MKRIRTGSGIKNFLKKGVKKPKLLNQVKIIEWIGLVSKTGEGQNYNKLSIFEKKFYIVIIYYV